MQADAEKNDRYQPAYAQQPFVPNLAAVVAVLRMDFAKIYEMKHEKVRSAALSLSVDAFVTLPLQEVLAVVEIGESEMKTTA